MTIPSGTPTDELRALAAERDEARRELDAFVSVAGHDLQEPLRMVVSYCRLLEERAAHQLDEEGREFLAFAVDGAARMQSMIADLLAYARVTSRGREPAPTDLDEVMGRVLTDLQGTIEDTGAVVTVGPLPNLAVDREQMTTLFRHLLQNALAFHGAERPEVQVSATREDGRWVFSIRDNGVGIDPASTERIFGVFQRLHGRDTHAGNGIGLALCQRIAARHGGSVWVESRTGEGSVFHVGVPDRQGALRTPMDKAGAEGAAA